METTNNRLYEFIEEESYNLFKSILDNEVEAKDYALAMAKCLSKNPDFESLRSGIRNSQTESIHRFPEKLPLWTEMYIQIIDMVEFAETYFKNLAYLKDAGIAFDNTYNYFYLSGKRPKRINSKI